MNSAYYEFCFRLAFLVNANFRMVITIQFLMSMLVVCFNLYVISLSKLDARCIRLALFMGCMLTQIFVYCWYGNEVRLKVQSTSLIFIISKILMLKLFLFLKFLFFRILYSYFYVNVTNEFSSLMLFLKLK